MYGSSFIPLILMMLAPAALAQNATVQFQKEIENNTGVTSGNIADNPDFRNFSLSGNDDVSLVCSFEGSKSSSEAPETISFHLQPELHLAKMLSENGSMTTLGTLETTAFSFTAVFYPHTVSFDDNGQVRQIGHEGKSTFTIDRLSGEVNVTTSEIAHEADVSSRSETKHLSRFGNCEIADESQQLQ